MPPIQKKFKATLRHLDEINLGWKVVDIPFDVKKAFGSSGRVPVRGTANGFPFRTSLFPKVDSPHYLMLNKQVQKGAGNIQVGDRVDIVIEADDEERTLVMPDLLKKAFAEEKGLMKCFQNFSYSMQKYMIDYTMEPKSAEARQRRAEQMAIRLMEVMDGELVPPPILEQHLSHNPKARRGWECMPPTHRRQHLFGIFSLSGAEARQRRVKKAVADMIKYSEKGK